MGEERIPDSIKRPDALVVGRKGGGGKTAPLGRGRLVVKRGIEGSFTNKIDEKESR